MKLHIPQRSTPDSDSFPTHPRKVRKWLSQLPTANMGNTARLVYDALISLNRQHMPPKHRLENLEQFRKPLRLILDHLHKHFVNRSLPLPEKSTKIVNLNQVLLREMSCGYKILISDASDSDNQIDDKTVVIAGNRAMQYMSELILRATQIYTEYPDGTWWDIHHIYTYMEARRLLDKQAKDEEAGHAITAEENYKRILLFSLARPHALRQNEAERLFNKLPTWCPKVRIDTNPIDLDSNFYFCAQPDTDRPPARLAREEIGNINHPRLIDTSELVNHLREHYENISSESDLSPLGEDQISQETVNTILASWNLQVKRRFSRADKSDKIRAIVGLKAIYHAVQEELEPQKEKSTQNDNMLSLSLIPEDQQNEHNSDGMLITSPGLPTSHADIDNWDLVARGNAISNAYIDNVKKADNKNPAQHKEEINQYWRIINISAGGFCLRWESEQASRAQVGELIAIQEKQINQNTQWRPGVIRWMQYRQGHGLDVGIKVLSPKLSIATVRRLNRPNEQPFESLLLPGIKPIHQPATLLLPAHAFKIDDKISLHFFDRNIQVKLIKILEHSGSFCQFQFAPIQAVKQSIKTDNKNTENFDSIWSSL